ncbi:hypothetical protein NH287_08520 [Microbacterium sp. CnD16-F]|uniref:hypothetical protein n=2 Tax=Microbacterium TaxID=33882 RepID=UPI001C2F28C9|nr:hypothetical protein [Microbacterium sp. CnD16-F]MCO7203533.1 hypothetical protein [Microbacterium sp. CnD16-F]
MSAPAVPPRLRRSGAGGVLAVAVLQAVAIVVTGVLWFLRGVLAGGHCSPSCDWGAADAAGMLFGGAILTSLVLTAVAAIVAWRTGRDLAWVPIVSASVVVAGYLAAAALFDGAVR